MKSVMEIAKIDTPWIIDPRPNSYIEEIQDNFPGLEYESKGDILTMKEAESFFGGLF